METRFWKPCQLDDLSEERQALLDEARAGSSEAQGALLALYRPEMLRYFARRLSRKLAEKADDGDLTQIACYRAVRFFGKFRGCLAADYRKWLMRICYNVLNTLLRQFGPDSNRDLAREELLDALKLDDGSQNPWRRRQPSADEIVAALETAGQLQAAIGRFPEKDREIFVLHHQQRQPFTAIARRLGQSADAVERSFKRALASLRRLLAAWKPAVALTGPLKAV